MLMMKRGSLKLKTEIKDATVTDIKICENSNPLDAIDVIPQQLTPSGNRLLVYFHGGAHFTGSSRGTGNLIGRLANALGVRVIGVDYRMAPDFPFPTGLDDALQAWRHITRELAPGAKVALAGDSAGGNLAFALTIKLIMLSMSQQSNQDTIPVGLLGLSPWLLLDLDTVRRVRKWHPIIGGDLLQAAYRAKKGNVVGALNSVMSGLGHDLVAMQYAQTHDTKDQLISPYFVDGNILSRFPPTAIHMGGAEPLVPDLLELSERMKAAGVELQVQIFPGDDHVFQYWPFTDAMKADSQKSFSLMSEFLQQHAW